MRIEDLLHRIAIERWDRDLAMGQAERAQACMLARRVRSSRKDRPDADRPELSNLATHHGTSSLDAVDEQRGRILLDATPELWLRCSRRLGVRPRERLHQIRVAREALDPDRAVADGSEPCFAGVEQRRCTDATRTVDQHGVTGERVRGQCLYEGSTSNDLKYATASAHRRPAGRKLRKRCGDT